MQMTQLKLYNPHGSLTYQIRHIVVHFTHYGKRYFIGMGLDATDCSRSMYLDFGPNCNVALAANSRLAVLNILMII